MSTIIWFGTNVNIQYICPIFQTQVHFIYSNAEWSEVQAEMCNRALIMYTFLEQILSATIII